jgi:hypothetical protein
MAAQIQSFEKGKGAEPEIQQQEGGVLQEQQGQKL